MVVLSSSSSGGDNSRQPYHVEQLYQDQDQDLLLQYDDEESPEMNMRMWAAIAESLRQWQQRKEEKAQAAAANTPNDGISQSDSPTTKKKSRKRRDEESVCYGRKEFCFKDKGPFDYLDTLPGKCW